MVLEGHQEATGISMLKNFASFLPESNLDRVCYPTKLGSTGQCTASQAMTPGSDEGKSRAHCKAPKKSRAARAKLLGGFRKAFFKGQVRRQVGA